jgi:hypothetical protein
MGLDRLDRGRLLRRRRLQFFLSTSFKAAMSTIASANSFFSWRFSLSRVLMLARVQNV